MHYSKASQSIKKYNGTQQQIVNIIFFLILFSQIGINRIASVRISSATIAVCLVISVPYSIVIGFRRAAIYNPMRHVFTGFVVLISLQIGGILLKINGRAFITVAQTILVMFFVILISGIDYEQLRTRSFNVLFGLYSLSVFLSYLFTEGKAGIFLTNENTSSGIFVFLSMINVLFVSTQKSKKSMLAFSILLLYPLLHLDSRISLALLVITPVVFLLLTINPAKKHTRNIIFLVLILVITVIVYVYPNVKNWEYYNAVNLWSYSTFGKNLQNERANIWAAVLTVTKTDWLFGLGTGAAINDVYSFIGSCHNQFVQVVLQNGLLGVATFVCTLWSIWLMISKSIENKICRYICACYFSVIIYNCFETTLLQNKLESGLIQWVFVGLGISYSRMIEKLELKGE